MAPSLRSTRSRKSAPRAMAARNSGASDKIARADPSAILTMSSVVSRSLSKRTIRNRGLSSVLSIAAFQRRQLPKVVKIIPLKRCAAAKVFEPARVVRRELGQRAVAFLARQPNRLAEQFKMNFRRAATAQCEQQINRALKQIRHDIRTHGKRRRRAKKVCLGNPRAMRHRNTVAGDGDKFALRDLLRE